MDGLSEQCIFCRIIRREVPARIVLETEAILTIVDIAPQAPIHYLVMPKRHIVDVRELTSHDAIIAGDLFMVARQLSALHNNAPCKLIMNNGYEVGQRVFHMHFHFLSGEFAHTAMIV